jgi:hypothetical protein
MSILQVIGKGMSDLTSMNKPVGWISNRLWIHIDEKAP